MALYLIKNSADGTSFSMYKDWNELVREFSKAGREYYEDRDETFPDDKEELAIKYLLEMGLTGDFDRDRDSGMLIEGEPVEFEAKSVVTKHVRKNKKQQKT